MAKLDEGIRKQLAASHSCDGHSIPSCSGREIDAYRRCAAGGTIPPRRDRACQWRCVAVVICFVGLVAFEGARAGDDYTEAKTYTYKTVGDFPIKADVYRLSGDDVRPVLVWIHGGALITGQRGGPNLAQRKRYLDAGHVIVSIDYRLAPETKLAGIIEDLRDAIAWVRAKGPAHFSIDPKRVAVVGHSAGGYLTLMAGFVVEPRPQALVAFYGYGDVDGDWYAKPDPFYRQTRPLVSKKDAYKAIGTTPIAEGNVPGRGLFYLYCRQNGLWPQEVVGHDPATEPRQFDRFCPVRNVIVNSLQENYPPTLLLHGDNDTDVPHDQSVAMAAELKRAGVAHEFISIKGGGHGFDGRGMQDADVSAAFDKVETFLKKHLGK
jgi:acetyl esterase/lipase